RSLLVDTIEEALEGLDDLSLLYLDLDGFKPINDRYGHAAGDVLLITVAERLRAGVPSEATVARLGGDEFAVLCRASSPTLARRLAEELHATLTHPIELEGHTVEVGASFGLVGTSMLAGSEVTADALLSAADAAMYEAKRDPERRVRTFDADIRARYERRCAVREAVRDALDRGEIDVAFQPDVTLATGQLHGLQVAPRLVASDLQHIDPDELVAAAQELGRLGALAGLVTDRLIGTVDAWVEEGLPVPPRLWVVASAGQLADIELHRRLVAVEARTGAAVGVQVHERVLADPSVVAALEELRGTGLRVAVMRFGAGTASFASLKQVGLDLLRVDPRFVVDVDVEPAFQATIQAFVQLAAALDVEVAADGLGSRAARFEQFAQYGTFADHISVNHAEFGVEILRQKGVLRDLDEGDQDLILRAIAYHNRRYLPEDETQECLYFSRMLRDADKLDIWNVVTEYYRNAGEEDSVLVQNFPDTPGISPAIYEDMVNARIANYMDVKNLNDFKLLQVGWVYDVNFPPTFRRIYERGYLDAIRRALPQSEQIEQIFSTAQAYLEARI
ncbi:MAG: diguanylate cyclase, partial [Dehalococcoidia bacterium]